MGFWCVVGYSYRGLIEAEVGEAHHCLAGCNILKSGWIDVITCRVVINHLITSSLFMELSDIQIHHQLKRLTTLRTIIYKEIGHEIHGNLNNNKYARAITHGS